MFGGSGGVSPRGSWNTGFGTALDGTAVTDANTFAAAAGLLRTRAGHDPSQNATWVNPPALAVYDQALAALGDPSSPTSMSVAEQVAARRTASSRSSCSGRL